MRNINSRYRWHTSTRRLRPQVVSDGVIASYIHDISGRHRDDAAAVQPLRRSAPRSVRGRTPTPATPAAPVLRPLAA